MHRCCWIKCLLLRSTVKSSVAFACSASSVTPHFISFLDLALLLLEHLARRPRERNSTNNSYDRYKSDSFIYMGVIVLLLTNNYLRSINEAWWDAILTMGTSKKLISRTGNPLTVIIIISFIVIAGHNIFLVKMARSIIIPDNILDFIVVICKYRVPAPVLLLNWFNCCYPFWKQLSSHSTDRAITKYIQAI